MKDCCIVIPTHKSTFDEDELISIKTLFKYLSNYDIYTVSHNRNSHIQGTDLKIFDEMWFSTYRNHNKFRLTTEFYEQFTNYKYMLIYETDSLVFSKDLDFWISLDYDYIGAPWLVCEQTNHQRVKDKTVGNGGFCLRNVSKSLRVLEDKRIQNLVSIYNRNEDHFWCDVVPTLFDFKIPDWYTALNFSFEVEPRKWYKDLGKLPFGCHGWNKYGKEFWLEVL